MVGIEGSYQDADDNADGNDDRDETRGLVVVTHTFYIIL